MTTEWEPCEVRCTCGDGNGQVVVRFVEDDAGHSDAQYHCNSCGRDWWEDGIDF
jgi:hypothetical protein